MALLRKKSIVRLFLKAGIGGALLMLCLLFTAFFTRVLAKKLPQVKNPSYADVKAAS